MDTPILSPTEANIARAAAWLREGRLVAMPTETVYGLAGDAGQDEAVAAIFAAKQRPQFNPLILHLAATEQAEALVDISPLARDLMARFWPGPLTLVLPRKAGAPVSLLASAGLDSLALRMPAHPVARTLIQAAGRPLAAPSANPSGRISPSLADHVKQGLNGRIAGILDGGPCKVGVESTVLSLLADRPTLLRPGGLARETLEAVLGPLATPEADHFAAEGLENASEGAAPRSPGMLLSHYAPECPVRLNALAPEQEGEALLAFGPLPEEAAGYSACINLSPSGNSEEAAAALFAAMRDLDRPGISGIAVMEIPEAGLGAAINDRLRRAAAPRG